MKIRSLVVTSLGHFINDGNGQVLPILYAFLVSHLSVPSFMIGIFAAIYYGISALLSPIIVRLVTSKPKVGIGMGIILWGIGLFLLGYSVELSSIPLIIMSVIVCGISSTFYHPLGSQILYSVFRGNAGVAMGINGSLGSLGRTLYPTISLLLFTVLGFMPITLWLIALISVFASMVIFLVPLDERSLYSTNNKASKKDQDPPDPIKVPIVAIVLLAIIGFLRSAFQRSVMQFLPSFLLLDYGYHYNVLLGLMVTVTYAGSIIGQPLMGLLSDRIGRRTTLAISGVGSIIMFLLFIKLPSPIFLFFFGLFTFTGFPLLLSTAGDLVPRRSVGFANSLVWGVGVTGGGAIGPLITGILSQFIGIGRALLIMIAFAVASLALIAKLPKPKKQSKTPLFGE
ncbi:MFS transporter [Sulfolobus tengchongensis]|uniref:MFS transporter n=1 Tax=Sulfolobus tengchongensis TaxID=207809 RepID=A0AAX4L2N8_9CREN